MTGADGCRGGWVAFCMGQQGEFVPHFAPHLQQLASICPPGLWLIDMILGLPPLEKPVRQCDLLAKQLLGAKRASVFPAMARELLEKYNEYADANAASKASTGKGLSLQSFYLRPKILEADAFVRSPAAAAFTIRESHPELIFQQLNGGLPLRFKKKGADGFAERCQILEKHWPSAGALLAHATLLVPKTKAVNDDWADALALAVYGYLYGQEMRALPEYAELDASGWPMQIWY